MWYDRNNKLINYCAHSRVIMQYILLLFFLLGCVPWIVHYVEWQPQSRFLQKDASASKVALPLMGNNLSGTGETSKLLLIRKQEKTELKLPHYWYVLEDMPWCLWWFRSVRWKGNIVSQFEAFCNENESYEHFLFKTKQIDFYDYPANTLFIWLGNLAHF